MIVVSDSSVVIGLAAAGRLDLLRALYRRVWIPQAVFDELARGEEQPGARDVREHSWIEVHAVRDRVLVDALRVRLGEGEAEAIALVLSAAATVEARLLLMDERRGRGIARRMGIDVTGTLGVLVEAKRKALLPAVRPVLDALVSRAGFRIGPQLYQRVLQEVGE